MSAISANLPVNTDPNASMWKTLSQSGQGQSSWKDLGGQGLSDLASKLVDSVDLSSTGKGMLSVARAQMEIEYQSTRVLFQKDGQQGMYEETRFSFRLQLDMLQISSGNEPLNEAALDSSTLMEKLQELFSPEQTAQRILDFALSWYAPQGEDSEAARQSFADEIGAAIQKGFDQAMNILGTLEEKIQEGINKTHELVFGGLDRFVTDGLPKDHETRSETARQYAALWQYSAQIEVSSLRAVTYSPKSGPVPPPLDYASVVDEQA